jgi:hypothetical protein
MLIAQVADSSQAARTKTCTIRRGLYGRPERRRMLASSINLAVLMTLAKILVNVFAPPSYSSKRTKEASIIARQLLSTEGARPKEVNSAFSLKDTSELSYRPHKGLSMSLLLLLCRVILTSSNFLVQLL